MVKCRISACNGGSTHVGCYTRTPVCYVIASCLPIAGDNLQTGRKPIVGKLVTIDVHLFLTVLLIF